MKRSSLSLLTRTVVIALIIVFCLILGVLGAQYFLKRQKVDIMEKGNESTSAAKLETSQLIFADGQAMSGENFNLETNDSDLPPAMLLPLKTLKDFPPPTAKTATIETEKGDLTLQLFTEKAPLSVANFCQLSEEKFYDQQKIHRLEPGFVLQTGDPLSKEASNSDELKNTVGTGFPGYRLADEFSSTLSHDRAGIVSLANLNYNGQYPHSSGSQFFITLAPATYLDGHYNIFAQVTDNLDLLNKLELGDEILQVHCQ